MQLSDDLLLYFDPAGPVPVVADDRITGSLQSASRIYRPDDPKPDISRARVILAGTGNPEEANAVRSHLYGLARVLEEGELVDIGNLRPGKTQADTRAGLADVIAELGRAGRILLLLAGDTHLTGVFGKAYDRLETPYNLTVVDPRIDLMDPLNAEKSHYLNALVSDGEGRLFDFAHLGYQAYLNDAEAVDRLSDLYFEHYRLGLLREDLREAEPVFRNTDIAVFSMSAVRMPDAPASRLPSPNGFTAEEACQLTRYAGLSDKLSLMHIGGFDPEKDAGGQTAALAAQMAWFFLQGVSQRKSDYPFTNINSYQKYEVTLPDTSHIITFYKSPASNRWWMQVPHPGSGYERSIYVACTYRDYLTANDGDIPDRWLNHYHRLSL